MPSPAELSILNPSIYLNGFEIREIVTSLTDVLTASICLFSYFKLSKADTDDRFLRNLRFYFLIMGVGLLAGGIFGHALQAYLTVKWKWAGWISSAVAFGFFVWGAVDLVSPYVSDTVHKILKLWAILQPTLFLTLLASPDFQTFDLVKVNSTVAVSATLLPLFFFHWIKTKHPGSKLMVFAFLYALIPGVQYNLKLSVSQWLNYHDISHLLMAIYTVMLYRAGKKFEGKVTPVRA